MVRDWLTNKILDSVNVVNGKIEPIEGTIPDPTNEPGRVVFTLSEQDTYKDPTVPYFCDIVETDMDGTSNANRIFIGSFNIIAGPNNAQAGGA